jgi:putative PIN family toxin of toxin-antitoxin system
MARTRVLLDTNIFVSGIVFVKGNDHEILRLVANEQIRLVLPETVLVEARKVLGEKFSNFETLLDIFLRPIKFEFVPLDQVISRLEAHIGKVSDRKDTPVFTAIVLLRPDYVVTGDATLRLDLRQSSEIARTTKVCSSAEFLRELRKRHSERGEQNRR